MKSDTVIYKFPLEVTDRQVINTYSGYNILTVQTQNEIPCLWLEINLTGDTNEKVFIYTHGTGHRVDERVRKYIGTYQLHKGSLVFHVYEGVE